ncbi:MULTISPECIES: hypothetical protein [unclassified Nostoc]|uniref:hypothetical protein n=1 Tax=unclassified Nostoc TaxID=2593658 RepID=UPI00260A3F33|nr:hypothetical protein [Nostoc sp. S13]MDF5738880.1 hypothetical protein [Nostoc sp. S13]
MATNQPGGEGQLVSRRWYKQDTYYQILEVHPPTEKEKRVGKKIATTILARKRGQGSQKSEIKDSFDEFKLDNETKEKLKLYPKHADDDDDVDEYKLSSYLPSPGVILSKGFIKALTGTESEEIETTEVNNFYVTTRDILQSRKLSQLIAKTWWVYLKAKEKVEKPEENPDLWKLFTDGKWDDIESNILDGLIAREIFLFAGGASPDNIENPEIYIPLKRRDDISNPDQPVSPDIDFKVSNSTDIINEVKTTGARFLILPNSKSWQGITLSLLFSGQAYYKRKGEYHQICQPIISTSEIISKYSFEADWSRFNGEFKELSTNQQSPWIVYQVIMPYPPIPSLDQLDPKDVKTWAEAEDDGGELPFYEKLGEDYTVNIDYFRSPYPYIPLTTS